MKPAIVRRRRQKTDNQAQRTKGERRWKAGRHFGGRVGIGTDRNRQKRRKTDR